MLNMMPLSRYTLSLQTRLCRQFILGTVILPTPFICELGGPYAEVEGTFCLEMVQVILGTGEWSGGCNLRWVWGWGGGSARLRWGRRPTTMSKLGLEGHNLCCQLVDMLLGGHGGALAQGL